MDALIRAAQSVNYDVVEALLTSEDVDVNGSDRVLYATPIQHAADNPDCSVRMMRLLLTKGADVNRGDCSAGPDDSWDGNGSYDLRYPTPLQICLKHGNQECINFLLDHGAIPPLLLLGSNVSFFHQASGTNLGSVIRHALAIESRDWSFEQYTVADDLGVGPVDNSLSWGALDALSAFLEHGSDIKTHPTAYVWGFMLDLIKAAWPTAGDVPSIVQSLLDNGFEPTEKELSAASAYPQIYSIFASEGQI